MFTRERLTKVVGAVLLLSPLPALAQTYNTQYNTRYYEPAPGVRRAYGPPSGYGSTVELGGGVMNFTGSAARGVTNSGGSWDLRLGWGTRNILGFEATFAPCRTVPYLCRIFLTWNILGFEAAYIGSANKLTASGLDPSAVLLGTGAEGVLRLNAPIGYRDSLIEPFAIGGLGWTRFDIVNDDYNMSSLKEKDHVMTVPVGAGLAMAVHGFIVDARYTYRFVYREDLIGNNKLDNWIISANLGSEF